MLEIDFIKYLTDLIGFKSITPNSNGAIEYIDAILKKHGFATDIKLFGHGDQQTTNLYAVYGRDKPNICFAGHVDVVPPGDSAAWQHSDPFRATLRDDLIYGRGAVDMKGALACMLSATLTFLQHYDAPKGAISFLITSDEEGSARHGTKEMLDYLYQNGHQIDFTIIGEPTCETKVGDIVKVGRRGSINFTLVVEGTQGHVAYPEKADNPVRTLVLILNSLLGHQFDRGSEFFGRSNLEVTSIDVGNEVSNVIPKSAKAKFNIRFNELQKAEDLQLLAESIIKKYTTTYQLASDISAHAFIQARQNLSSGFIKDFVDIVTTVTKVPTALSTSGGTSDARFIKNYSPCVEFGLLSSMAHKVDEYTKIGDLQNLHNVYYQSLCKFLC